MRKRLIDNVPQPRPEIEQLWLNLDEIAEVEITSEATAYPIDDAFVPGGESGWRADKPGEQIIRLLFDSPQRISRIWLSFKESDIERTQEFSLHWSADHGQTYSEITRQQWNFSPTGAIREVEDYHVNLSGVTTLELRILPDISGGNAHASLAQLRLS